MPGVNPGKEMERGKRKREREEVDVDNVGSDVEVKVVKSVKSSKEDRVWQYINKRSLFVSPPATPQLANSELSLQSNKRIEFRIGQPYFVNNDLFKEKTSSIEVAVNQSVIKVTLTKECEVVREWVERQSCSHFGLDLEWQPNRKKCEKENKVALMQISSETECLLVQMLFLDKIPSALVEFLKNPDIKFAGVGIHGDTKKLERDYGLVSAGEVELTTLAVVHLKSNEFKRAGLKTIARQVIGYNMNKSKSVTMSNWSRSHLDRRQVEYATLDAWVSLAIFQKMQNVSCPSL